MVPDRSHVVGEPPTPSGGPVLAQPTADQIARPGIRDVNADPLQRGPFRPPLDLVVPPYRLAGGSREWVAATMFSRLCTEHHRVVGPAGHRVSAAVQPAGAARPQRHPALRRQPAAWVALLAFVLYLAPAIQVVHLNPDAVEYVDIARRLAAGDGYRLGVKAYHFGGTQVLHDGLAERSPLYPLVAAALLRAGVGLAGLQAINALLAAGCVALVCALGMSLFGSRVGTLAGLLAATSPLMLVRMLPPMTEGLAISLSLLATWLVVRYAEPPQPSAFAVAGAALGLAQPDFLNTVPTLHLAS